MELSLTAAMQCVHSLRLFTSPACCRDAEVLSLFAAIINKLGRKMEKEVPRIFEAVFQVTLDMITKNFEVGHLSAGHGLWGPVELRCFQDMSAACGT